MSSSIKKWIIVGIVVVALAIIGVFVYQSSHRPLVVDTEPVAEKNIEPQHSVIGHSVEGRDIDAYTYGKGSTHLLFVGGIHGGYEWNSVFLAYKFMDYLAVNPDLITDNITVTVIPSANPDAVYKVVGKEGRFDVEDVSTSTTLLESARFNANGVDLNRNFDCKWQPKSTWKNKTVSAGTSAFSEPEARAIRDFASVYKPVAAVFWHSQSNAVYASQCSKGILPGTVTIMNAYAKAAGYPVADTFDAYTTTGAADDWLATQGIPAITVELSTHDTIEWTKNLAGIKAFLKN